MEWLWGRSLSTPYRQLFHPQTMFTSFRQLRYTSTDLKNNRYCSILLAHSLCCAFRVRNKHTHHTVVRDCAYSPACFCRQTAPPNQLNKPSAEFLSIEHKNAYLDIKKHTQTHINVQNDRMHCKRGRRQKCTKEECESPWRSLCWLCRVCLSLSPRPANAALAGAVLQHDRGCSAMCCHMYRARIWKHCNWMDHDDETCWLCWPGFVRILYSTCSIVCGHIATTAAEMRPMMWMMTSSITTPASATNQLDAEVCWRWHSVLSACFHRRCAIHSMGWLVGARCDIAPMVGWLWCTACWYL